MTDDPGGAIAHRMQAAGLAEASPTRGVEENPPRLGGIAFQGTRGVAPRVVVAICLEPREMVRVERDAADKTK
ncbi:hypothetical protein FACS1894158_07190 [Betaproteobacteria bacterium]|nr:hypothetical protein FACS1894158_07190 [Betaproteobacteria bacterium]